MLKFLKKLEEIPRVLDGLTSDYLEVFGDDERMRSGLFQSKEIELEALSKNIFEKDLESCLCDVLKAFSILKEST